MTKSDTERRRLEGRIKDLDEDIATARLDMSRARRFLRWAAEYMEADQPGRAKEVAR